MFYISIMLELHEQCPGRASWLSRRIDSACAQRMDAEISLLSPESLIEIDGCLDLIMNPSVLN